MKTAFLSLALMFFTVLAYSQPFEKESGFINAGIGFGGDLDYLGNQSPAISASFEKGLWDLSGPGVISLGGYLGFQSFKDRDYWSSYYTTERWRYTIIGFRGAYHYNGFTSIPQLDVYGGAMLSYNILSYSYTDSDGVTIRGNSGRWGNRVGLTAYLGGRWMFKEKVGAYLEVGYGVTAVSLGATFKL